MPNAIFYFASVTADSFNEVSKTSYKNWIQFLPSHLRFMIKLDMPLLRIQSNHKSSNHWSVSVLVVIIRRLDGCSDVSRGGDTIRPAGRISCITSYIIGAANTLGGCRGVTEYRRTQGMARAARTSTTPLINFEFEHIHID